MVLRALLLGLVVSCTSTVPGGLEGRPDASTAPLPEDEEPGDTGEGNPGAPDGESPGDPDEESAVELTVSPTSLTIDVGEVATIDATVVTEQTPPPKVGWVSSNTTVAIVSDGMVRGMTQGTAIIRATAGGEDAQVMVTVSQESPTGTCVNATGDNGDSCAGIYQGSDIWRCASSPAQGGKTVSQVCRDSGNGPRWITFHIDPTNCCACDGAFNVGCCTVNSGSSGCP